MGSGQIITAAEELNMDETGADVTDATNVLSAGAVMTSGTQTISAETFVHQLISITGIAGTAATAATCSGNAGTVTNGVYTTSSVTALSDVSNAGSGKIITDAERTKLSGIETGANVTDADNVLSAGAVMTSGNQTISGAKTFNSATTLNSTLSVGGTSTLTGNEVQEQIIQC